MPMNNMLTFTEGYEKNELLKETVKCTTLNTFCLERGVILTMSKKIIIRKLLLLLSMHACDNCNL